MSAQTSAAKAAQDGLNAAKAAVGGTARALADRLHITPAAVCKWGNAIPLRWVLPVEEATGVQRHVLRPDIFPEPQRRRARRAA